MEDVIIVDGLDVKKMKRDKAMQFYLDCMSGCEGAERDGYTNIYLDLKEGRDIAWDGEFVPKGAHECQYCYRLARGTDKDRLCDDCAMTFGHSLYSEL